MGEQTKIEWCDHTWNPWIGCAKVHTGCVNCYAEADMANRRKRVVWGENGTRSVTSDAYWKRPKKWNRDAEKDRVRRRVFCASLSDVFEDRPELVSWRDGLFELIDDTPWLDWQLLTKRPENIARMWQSWWDMTVKNATQPSPIEMRFRKNVWLGTSVSNQATADKAVPELLKCRDLSPVLFLSCEPLIGPVDLSEHSYWQCPFCRVAGTHEWSQCREHGPMIFASGIDWVIVGGESGPKARPCSPLWISSLVNQCGTNGIPCFVKQLGQNCVTRNDSFGCESEYPGNFPEDMGVEHNIHGILEKYQGADCRVRFSDKKGGNPDEWPPALRVRQFPKV